MRKNQLYKLWFVNQSCYGGQVCVYQDSANAICNQVDPIPLAWKVAATNPMVQVRFSWNTDYNFAWFDNDLPHIQQIISASPDTGSAVTFGQNKYGYDLQPSTTRARRGQLSIQTDDSILPRNNTIVGIGMDGAATFAVPVWPNNLTVFTPVQDNKLIYWISFGAYHLSENQALDITVLNAPAKIIFPRDVYEMTAVLNSQNLWTIHNGSPTAI